MSIPRWQWLGRVMLDDRLSPGAKVVAYWMAEHARANTMIAYPSVDTLVRLTGFSERQVQYGRRELVDRGWLAIADRKPGLGGGARYKLTIRSAGISSQHAGIKAAERLFRDGAQACTNSDGDGAQPGRIGAQIGGDGAQACTPIGAQACTQTSYSKPRQRTSSASASGADADDGLADGIVKQFKQCISDTYGQSARHTKSEAILRQEVADWINAGYGPAELVFTLRTGVQKMYGNGHVSPMCLAAFRLTLEETLRELQSRRKRKQPWHDDPIYRNVL